MSGTGDYISREATLSLAKDICVPTQWGTEYRHRSIDPLDVIELPAADVRPVVLCRDCQHWDTDWIPSHVKGNEHFCPFVGLTTRSDWFCADGEKREESR